MRGSNPHAHSRGPTVFKTETSASRWLDLPLDNNENYNNHNDGDCANTEVFVAQDNAEDRAILVNLNNFFVHIQI